MARKRVLPEKTRDEPQGGCSLRAFKQPRHTGANAMQKISTNAKCTILGALLSLFICGFFFDFLILKKLQAGTPLKIMFPTMIYKILPTTLLLSLIAAIITRTTTKSRNFEITENATNTQTLIWSFYSGTRLAPFIVVFFWILLEFTH
jgi:hypothetical protein